MLANRTASHGAGVHERERTQAAEESTAVETAAVSEIEAVALAAHVTSHK